MKRQNGFISSSSSTSVVYTAYTTITNKNWSDEVIKVGKNPLYTYYGESSDSISELVRSQTGSIIWKTFATTSYQKIESFLTAIEKVNEPYSKNTQKFLPLYSYNSDIKNLYKGFIDIVITLPVETRLAGLELLNPWSNKLTTDKEGDYWEYLPKKFNIYKVNTDLTNKALEKLTYENDIAKYTINSLNETSIRRNKIY